MTRFLDLVAVEGPERGMRFSIEEGSYRVLVRAPDERSTTLHMTPSGDRALDAEQAGLVQDMLARRARGTRMQLQKRGPDIVLRDGSVSCAHALVFVHNDSATILDLMSTNGTRVNGTDVRDGEVYEGDVIHVGQTKLRVEAG